jgi:Domain of unknown function (DUF4186)
VQQEERRRESRYPLKMRPLDDVFCALSGSPFRQRFRLGPKEQAYVSLRSTDEIAQHARRIIQERLAPAQPKNDGKQTPMRGHPVFIAQHATATCCRGCLVKWHGIPEGVPMSSDAQDHAVAAIVRWIDAQPKTERREPSDVQLKLAL